MTTEPSLKSEYYESTHYTPFESKVFTQHNRDCSIAQTYGGRIHFRSSQYNSRPDVTNSLDMVKYWALDLSKEQTAWKMSSYSSYSQYLRTRIFGGDFPVNEVFNERKEQEYYENIKTTGEDI